MAEHGAIPILREEVDTRQRHLERRRDDLRRTVDEIKTNLDWLMKEPNNLNPSARLGFTWQIFGRKVDDMQSTAREILELRRAIAVLEREPADDQEEERRA